MQLLLIVFPKLKAIAEEIPFITGGARLGSQVKLGYFDQHHKNLDPRNTVFQQIHAVNPQAVKQDVLGFLAKFQFRGDEVDKPVTAQLLGEKLVLFLDAQGQPAHRQGHRVEDGHRGAPHQVALAEDAVEERLVVGPGVDPPDVVHDLAGPGGQLDRRLPIHDPGRQDDRPAGEDPATRGHHLEPLAGSPCLDRPLLDERRVPGEARCDPLDHVVHDGQYVVQHHGLDQQFLDG